MALPDQSVIVLLNGELYNFRELRQELQQGGAEFRTDTDTEILLHLYQRDPEHPERWLKQINGIFAIALWDRHRNRLLLARDHFGVKPLHFAEQQGQFLFASEIKSLLAAGWPSRLNREALHAFLNIRFVPGTQTLFEGVQRLAPGHYSWVEPGRSANPQCYYTLPQHEVPDRQAVAGTLRDRYFEAVQAPFVSEVRLGIALSGGLDSSMNVAAAHAAMEAGENLRTYDQSIRTFTLGFNEPTDENADAQIVADHFATTHFETYLETDPLSQMNEVIRAVEEPKVNMIQGYELARFVQPEVKVLFSGLGGDELFAGYDIHRFCNSLGRWHSPVFKPLNILRTPLYRLVHGSGMLKAEHARIGSQIALSLGDRVQFYLRLRNAWAFDRPAYHRIYARPEDFLDLPCFGKAYEEMFQSSEPFLEQVLRAEFHQKMVNDFLVNEDRVTSAHGVEGRVPFLDRNFVELAFSIPSAWKMEGTETKSLWKQSVGEVLPNAILNKTKQGFTFSSYHQWEKDLREVVQRELTEDWCRGTGLFNYDFVKEVLDYPAHPALRWHYFLAWKMLGTKQWMEIFNVGI